MNIGTSFRKCDRISVYDDQEDYYGMLTRNKVAREKYIEIENITIKIWLKGNVYKWDRNNR